MSPILKPEIYDWEDFVEEFKNHENNDSIIFRGQSNFVRPINDPQHDSKGRIITRQLVEWKLESSFYRYYELRDSQKHINSNFTK